MAGGGKTRAWMCCWWSGLWSEPRTRAALDSRRARCWSMNKKSTSRGRRLPRTPRIRLLGDDMPYVSRGGLKLAGGAGALEDRCEAGPASTSAHRRAASRIACCSTARRT